MAEKNPEIRALTMSVEQLAEQLGISLAGAYALCRREGFPAVRVSPRRIVIAVEGLKEWMARNYGA